MEYPRTRKLRKIATEAEDFIKEGTNLTFESQVKS